MSRLVKNMFILDHHVCTEMQCMILGVHSHKVARSSISMWLHYWTNWNIKDCDKIVDSVISVSSSKTIM